MYYIDLCCQLILEEKYLISKLQLVCQASVIFDMLIPVFLCNFLVFFSFDAVRLVWIALKTLPPSSLSVVFPYGSNVHL